MSAGQTIGPQYVDAAFGAENRARLMAEYFESSIAPRSTWEHVYRLLLWVDQRSGLAHCYESDKSQPGKNWYGRSLAFHDWVASALAVAPTHLGGEIDWLFRRATADLAKSLVLRAKAEAQKGDAARALFAREMPRPGDDPELIAIITEVLGDRLADELPPDLRQILVQRIRQHLSLENKRKNLVGEGFEDVIAEVVRRRTTPGALDVRARAPLHELPGFNRQREGDKDNKVDVAIISKGGRRVLVTAKWSVRADREKQFEADFAKYNDAESFRKRFEYVFVTNEFDPARLKRACVALVQNSDLFTHVVHINPDAIRATYGPQRKASTMKDVLDLIDRRRLIGVDDWVSALCG